MSYISLKDRILSLLRTDISKGVGRHLKIAPLCEEDIPEMVLAFKNIGWNKPYSLFDSYLTQQNADERCALVAKINGLFCGYVTIKWKSGYQNFLNENIPEIADLNVLPIARKQGVGTALIRECEISAKKFKHKKIGLGVGLLQDYGNAQRLYFKLGFIPDGFGLHYNYQIVNYADSVSADDDLVIYLSKEI